MNLQKSIIPLIILSWLWLGMSFTTVLAEEDPSPESDVTAPVIILLGDPTVSLNVGDTYVDAGATASDDVDGDITSHIIVDNPVDTAIAGDYVVSYSVSDTAGNIATPVTRQVLVQALAVVPSETFIIRHDDSVIWQGSVALPASGTVSINDSNGVAHAVDTRSVLAMLYSIDQSSDAFSISKLPYYDSFGSFYLQCITPAGGAELCDNWQYAIGNTTPWQSIDANILSGGETVGVFFGSPHRLDFSAGDFHVGTAFAVKTEKYNYLNNAWDILPGVSVGVTMPNPDDPWNPTIISTQAVDASGQASITISEPGNYNLGIVEDFYFPIYPVTVLAATPAPTSFGGGSAISPKKYFDIPLALSYLRGLQADDGSFGGGAMYSDWVAIAYGAADVKDASRDLLLDYLGHQTSTSSLLTDNERRAMALLALGANPYDFAGNDYIKIITKSFDGQQFGDSNLVNDDIFALLPLLSAGYTQDDEMIRQVITYILSQQAVDGSWNHSVDMSAAAIQALGALRASSQEIADALGRAEQYITSQQNSDGGFGSIYTTSWATQAMTILGKTWTKDSHQPSDYLATQQASDGAALGTAEPSASRVWATSYAIPAVLGKDWSSIFKTVAKPTVVEEPLIVESIAPEATSTVAVLGVKEVAPVKDINKKAVVIAQAPVNNEEVNTAEATSTADVQSEMTATTTTEESKSIDMFLSLGAIVAVLVGGA